ncbi:hypothetical protein K440DRAFT_635750 [Wilcoxina mikolae CBS 423.85]|nr:hypothetical protein K440DRAFT_635750 [Wilcoxina mikolae CBS 423.85]
MATTLSSRGATIPLLEPTPLEIIPAVTTPGEMATTPSSRGATIPLPEPTPPASSSAQIISTLTTPGEMATTPSSRGATIPLPSPTQPTKAAPSSKLPKIIGPIVAIVVVLAIILVAFFFWRRRRRNHRHPAVPELEARTHIPPIELSASDKQEPTWGRPSELESPHYQPYPGLSAAPAAATALESERPVPPDMTQHSSQNTDPTIVPASANEDPDGWIAEEEQKIQQRAAALQELKRLREEERRVREQLEGL